VPEAFAIARSIANALAVAHAAGIVHRDLKPANVMVRPDGAVKVMDFGLAKAPIPDSDEFQSTRTLEPGTGTGVVMGTAPYMSPEQAEGKSVDARSDIFSFGAALYEMLTGHRAFQGDNLIATISSVMKDTPAPLHHVRREIEPPFEEVVDRCLSKNRHDRYESGTELTAALDSVAAPSLPTRARPAMFVAAPACFSVCWPAARGGPSSSVAPTGFTTRRSRKFTNWPPTKNLSSRGNSVCARSRSFPAIQRWNRRSPHPRSHLALFNPSPPAHASTTVLTSNPVPLRNFSAKRMRPSVCPKPCFGCA